MRLQFGSWISTSALGSCGSNFSICADCPPMLPPCAGEIEAANGRGIRGPVVCWESRIFASFGTEFRWVTLILMSCA